MIWTVFYKNFIIVFSTLLILHERLFEASILILFFQHSIRLFADNTTLYIIVDNPVQAVNLLNSDLL